MGRCVELVEKFYVENNSGTKVSNLVHYLLSYANRFHIIHLQTKKHSEHMVTNEIYDMFREYADKLAEQLIGSGGVLGEKPETNEFIIPANELLKSVIYLTDDINCDVEHIQATIEELRSSIASMNYKLELK